MGPHYDEKHGLIHKAAAKKIVGHMTRRKH